MATRRVMQSPPRVPQVVARWGNGRLRSRAIGTGRERLIWQGFAASGIGVGAGGVVKPSGALTITESFAVPASCQ